MIKNDINVKRHRLGFNMLSKRKKRTFISLTVIAVLLVIIFLSELVLSLLGYKYEYKYLGALDYALVADKTFCTWNESLYPHPYLGFVQSQGLECSFGKVNNKGFISPNFPHKKNEKYFDVLVMGGSVAAQLIGGISFGLDGYLFKLLNKNFVDARGREVRVFSTATGAWKQPQQLNSYILYGDVFDAILSVEGANETAQFGVNEVFEQPFGIYWGVAKYPDVNLDKLIARVKYLKKLQRKYKILNLSSLYQTYLLKNAEEASLKFNELFYKSWSNKIFTREDQTTREEHAQRYLEYVEKLNILTKNSNQNFLTFIQPILEYKKPVHEKEKSIAKNENQLETYRVLVERLRKSPVENVILLSDIFEKTSEHIYLDYVHFDFHPNEPEAVNGQKIVAEKIIDVVSRKWNLQKKSSL